MAKPEGGSAMRRELRMEDGGMAKISPPRLKRFNASTGQKRPLTSPARKASARLLMEITGRDGEFVSPHRADDVARKIFAPVLAARFSVKKSHLSAESDTVRRPQIDNVIDRIPAVGPIRESGARRLPRIERRQKLLRGSHRTESGREQETVLIAERERRRSDPGPIQRRAIKQKLVRTLRRLRRRGKAKPEKSSKSEKGALRHAGNSTPNRSARQQKFAQFLAVQILGTFSASELPAGNFSV